MMSIICNLEISKQEAFLYQKDLQLKIRKELCGCKFAFLHTGNVRSVPGKGHRKKKMAARNMILPGCISCDAKHMMFLQEVLGEVLHPPVAADDDECFGSEHGKTSFATIYAGTKKR